MSNSISTDEFRALALRAGMDLNVHITLKGRICSKLKNLDGCTLTNSSSIPTSDKNFVVYEHDRYVRNQLELLLRREMPSDIARKYEWDESKLVANIAKHGVDFDAVNRFVWRTSILKPSPRGGEMRFAATDTLGNGYIYSYSGGAASEFTLSAYSAPNRQEVRDYERNRTDPNRADLS